MLIDWFTVAAQAINFLVLVWLLKRYLYRPILAAVDAREARVMARLTEAQLREREAADAAEALAREREALEAARAERLAAADRAAASERERLLEAARAEAAAQRERLAHALELERETRLEALTARLGAEVVAIAGQVLQELAGADLEEHMAARCLQRLRALEPAERDALVTALTEARRPPRVRSGVALPATLASDFTRTLAALAPQAPSVVFEEAPDLIAGVELLCDGHRWSWTVDDYLQELARTLREDAGTSGPATVRAA